MKEKIDVKDVYKDAVYDEEFHSYTVISGKGRIKSCHESLELEKGDTIYIPKCVEYKIKGQLELLKSYV